MVRLGKALLGALLIAWLGSDAFAQIPEPITLSQARDALDRVAAEFEADALRGNRSIDQALITVNENRSRVLQCVTTREQELDALRSSLGADYVKEIQEKSERTNEEEQLADQIAVLSERISECKLLLEAANSLQTELVEAQLTQQRATLVQRHNHLLSNIQSGATGLRALVRERLQRITEISAAERDQVRLSSISVIALVSIGIGLLIRRRCKPPAHPDDEAVTFRILIAGWFIVRKWAPILLPIVTVSAYLLLTERSQFLQHPVNRLILLVIGYLLVLIFFVACVRWYQEYASKRLNFSPPARQLLVRLFIGATTSFLWIALLSLPGEAPLDNPSYLLLHNILGSAVVISHLELALFIPRIVPRMSRIATLARVAAITLLGIALLFEYLGYLEFSTFLWGGVLASVGAILVFVFVAKLFNDTWDSLDSGAYRWQQRFRSTLSIDPQEPVPGLVWIRLLTIAMLWVGLGLLLLKAWGFPDARIASIFSFLRDGIKIGDSQIVLSDVLVGILLFSLLLMLIRWGKDSLDRKYLSRSRLDSGAREAIVTISGYVGFVVATLIGLSVAGVKLGNLAIIAGALSLGIGFGLQNIVNNFVSGIILLFERPIRTGDWIITGTTEGYVRKISVRSTEVQTFDRSDVIVPNSELISAEVTNWTLRDKFGRVIVPVGVAYGSDTQLVKKLLEEIPEDFPEIVKDRPMLPVKVFFRAFGDSTLDFELRCFIYDIATILEVKSNLHFAIDKAFREHGIEIAFPQRDIHIRSSIQGNGLTEGD